MIDVFQYPLSVSKPASMDLKDKPLNKISAHPNPASTGSATALRQAQRPVFGRVKFHSMEDGCYFGNLA
jgi:hypothetical protein